MAAIPPGSTWFDTIKKSFADVPIDAANEDAISTAEFLEAAESLVSLFGELAGPACLTSGTNAWPFPDVLGSVAFNPVKNDLLGNIKVRRLSLHDDERWC